MDTFFFPQSFLAQTETSFPRHLALTMTVITLNAEIQYHRPNPYDLYAEKGFCNLHLEVFLPFVEIYTAL